MKKILLMSLAVMLLSWNAASAVNPTTSRNEASPKIDSKAEPPSQSITSLGSGNRANGVLPEKKSAARQMKSATAQISNDRIISSDGRSASQFLAEKKMLKKKAASALRRKENERYAVPPALPHWYDPQSITDIILTEDFENSGRLPTGWDDCCNHQLKWKFDGGNPDYGAPAPHGGSYAAFFDVFNYDWGTTDTLISPSMDLSIHSGSYAIAFWYWDGPDAEGVQDSITLFVSEGGVDTYLGKLPQSVPAWTQLVYTFNSTSNDVTIKFAGFSCYGYTDPYIDDFVVADFVDMGRCCYGDPANPSCDENSQAECEALNGNWLYGATCASDPCQAVIPGDNCSAPFEITSFPFTDTRNSTDFNSDYNDWNTGDVVYRFTITEPMLMNIGLCNTEVPFSTYMGVWREGNCGSSNLDINSLWGDCSAYWELASITNSIFAAGTYYILVEPSWNSPSGGIYTLDVTADPATPVIDFQVTAPGQWTGNTCGAGNDCGIQPSEDHIYEVTIPYDATWLFALCNTPLVWDTYMSIGTSYCSADIASNDDGCGNPGYYLSRISVPLTAGVYYVTVEGYALGGCGDYNLDIVEAPPPPWNDNCADVNPADYPLSDGVPLVFNGDNSNATQDCDANGLSEVWIPFSTDVCMDITINYCGTIPTPFWANITMYDACPCADAIFANDYNWEECGDGNWTLHFYHMPPGNYYYPLNADLTWDPTGPYTCSVIGTACQPPPDNDLCSNATPIGNVDNLPWSTIPASFEGNSACMFSADIWYRYTADCDGIGLFSLCGSSFDTKLAVYDGATCDPLPTLLECNDEACGSQSQIIIPVTAGSEYLIEIGGYDIIAGEGVLTTACAPASPSDNCVDVNPAEFPLSDSIPVIYQGNNINATSDCGSLGWAEVWIPFHTDTCMNVIINSCGTMPVLTTLGTWLFSDCPCGAHIVLNDYNSTECPDGNWTAYFDNLPAGDYYYPLYSDSAQGFYTITVTGTICQPPPPNFCENGDLILSNGGPSASGTSYSSQCDPVYPFAAGTADDFVLPGTGANTITNVVGYLGFWNDFGPVATPADLTGIMITFYSDNAGSPGGKPINGDPNCAHEELIPGGVIYSQLVAPENFTYNMWTRDTWQVDCTIIPVDLNSGTTYWLEIAPVLPDFATHGQSAVTVTDNITGASAMLIFEEVPGYGQWTTLDPPTDVAFCLRGYSDAIGTISGTVTDGTNPLSDVTIVTHNAAEIGVGNNISDASGNWSLDLPPDTYHEHLTKTGFNNLTINNIVVAAGNTTVVNAVMTLSGPCDYAIGDINGNGARNGLDVVYGVSYFKGGPFPPFSCECTPGNTWFVSGDVNGSCNFNGLDISYLVSYFKGGPLPIPCADCPPAGLLAPPAPGEEPAPAADPIQEPIFKSREQTLNTN